MKQLTAIVFILFSYHSQAQSSGRFKRESFFFGDYLREVRSPDSLARITHAIQDIDQLQGDSLPSSYFSRGRYRLLYFHTFGWGQYLSQPRTEFDQKFSSDASGKLVASQEIFRLLGMQGKDSTVLRQFPVVRRRDDFYNRRWIPISCSSRYLVLRHVSSYPDGNITSHYGEQIYDFERVN
jgi:hypothetical protein